MQEKRSYFVKLSLLSSLIPNYTSGNVTKETIAVIREKPYLSVLTESLSTPPKLCAATRIPSHVQRTVQQKSKVKDEWRPLLKDQFMYKKTQIWKECESGQNWFIWNTRVVIASNTEYRELFWCQICRHNGFTVLRYNNLHSHQLRQRWRLFYSCYLSHAAWIEFEGCNHPSKSWVQFQFCNISVEDRTLLIVSP